MERQPAKNMPSYQITIAVPGSAFGLSRIYTHLRDIAQQADYLQLMTYDLHGPWDQQTHHQAHLFAEKDEALFHHPLRALAPASLSAADKDRLYPPMFAMTIDAAVQQYLTGGACTQAGDGYSVLRSRVLSDRQRNQGLFQPFVTQAGSLHRPQKICCPDASVAPAAAIRAFRITLIWSVCCAAIRDIRPVFRCQSGKLDLAS
jgi:hypothetical protein